LQQSESYSDPEDAVERPINEESIVNCGFSDSEEEQCQTIENYSPSFKRPLIVSTQNSPSKVSISTAINIEPNESTEQIVVFERPKDDSFEIISAMEVIGCKDVSEKGNNIIKIIVSNYINAR
jgi:hypothetical protein